MKICLVAIGTPGDVLPVLALALGFQRRGHTVRFASTADFQPQCVAAGLDFFLMQGDTRQFFTSGLGVAFRELIAKPDRFKRLYRTYLSDFIRRNLRDTWAACEGFDTAICPPWINAAPSLSEKLGNPCFGATVAPVHGIPTRAYPDPYSGPLPSSPDAAGNLRSWRASTALALAPLEDLNDWRAGVLGLPPLSAIECLRTYRQAPYLLGYSPAVLPKPVDLPAQTTVTGFWFPPAPEQWQPSPELSLFLERHPFPLLLGFSSQTPRDREGFAQRLVQAVALYGRPAILLAGWGSLDPASLPPNLLVQPAIPYDWIVPRVCAFVHHGGSGSMGVSLRHGIPGMAMPFGVDQHMWANRLFTLGCGPAPLDPQHFRPEELAGSMTALADYPTYKRNAQLLSQQIAQEDGVAAAIAIVEQHIALRTCS